jgi:hypothetical protein
LHDGFLFSIPYKQNWRIADAEVETVPSLAEVNGEIQ